MEAKNKTSINKSVYESQQLLGSYQISINESNCHYAYIKDFNKINN